jgi:ferrous-iron efflux pump FieF
VTGAPVAPSNTMATGADAERLKRGATTAAVSVAAILIAIKLWAWIATDSVAMLASLLDSGVDFLASAVNLIAVRHALTPADHEHRFGHGKAEAIAGLGQAGFISLSAAFLFYESVSRLIAPQPIDESTTGLVVIGVSIALTLGLVLYQRRVISRTRSLAIEADRLHYASDILTNLGVVLALVLAGFWGIAIADPLIGIAIGAFIAWTAFSILRGAYNELMDHEFDDDDRQRIKDIVKHHRDVVSLHDLRTRRAGHRAFIQLHLELPAGMTLAEAHRISDDVERAIEAAFPDAEVLIHQDPAGFEQV